MIFENFTRPQQLLAGLLHFQKPGDTTSRCSASLGTQLGQANFVFAQRSEELLLSQQLYSKSLSIAQSLLEAQLGRYTAVGVLVQVRLTSAVYGPSLPSIVAFSRAESSARHSGFPAKRQRTLCYLKYGSAFLRLLESMVSKQRVQDSHGTPAQPALDRTRLQLALCSISSFSDLRLGWTTLARQQLCTDSTLVKLSAPTQRWEATWSRSLIKI